MALRGGTSRSGDGSAHRGRYWSPRKPLPTDAIPRGDHREHRRGHKRAGTAVHREQRHQFLTPLGYGRWRAPSLIVSPIDYGHTHHPRSQRHNMPRNLGKRRAPRRQGHDVRVAPLTHRPGVRKIENIDLSSQTFSRIFRFCGNCTQTRPANSAATTCSTSPPIRQHPYGRRDHSNAANTLIIGRYIPRVCCGSYQR